jgi:hypothetical protein
VVPPRLRSNRERHSCAVTGLPGDDYLFHHPGLSSEKAGEFGLCIPVDTVKGSHVRSLLADGMTYYSCHDLDYILVDPEGFEPSTFSMPLRRAPNCAMGPYSFFNFRSTFCKPVDLRGFEPLTFSVRLRRAPNCATGPSSKCRVFYLRRIGMSRRLFTMPLKAGRIPD